MKQKLLIVLWMCLGMWMHTFAQERSITGRVTDPDTGEGIPGVSVFVKGTTVGVVTDGGGNYKINVAKGSILVFQSVGFITTEVVVSEESVIDMKLSADIKQLNEIIVSGYGVKDKIQTTGAVSNVKGKDIENIPVQSFDRALQGRAAGVQIQSASGTPGGAVQVRIRGTGSITAGNEPLYIVDGVLLNNRNDGGGVVSNNPLAFLNPNDIESIDVLKDAANAAIYGAQAANGVVIITTKKGKNSGKTNVTLNYYRGSVVPIRYLDLMNTQQYIQVRSEARFARPSAGITTFEQARSAVLGELGFPTDLSPEAINELTTYDWQRAVYKNADIDNFEVSASGGNEKTTFFASASYNAQDATLINIDYKRISGRISLNHKINSKVSLELGLNLSNIKQRGPYGSADGTTAFSAPQYSSPLILPSNQFYNENGTYFGLPGSGQVIRGDINTNVIAAADLTKRNGNTNQLVGNFSLTYEVIKGLFLKGFVGLDYRTVRTNTYTDPRLPDAFNFGGTGLVDNDVNSNFTTNYTVNYIKTFAEKHSFSGLAGVEYREEIYEGDGATAQGFPSPDFQTLNAASTPNTITGFWTSNRRFGVFSNLKYEYDKKYILSFVLRYDGSSRFGANNRYGYFPSISLGWNMHEENFLKGVSFLNELRLRGSWGTTGNDQIGNFAARSLYTVDGLYNGASGIGPGGLGNPDLKWEKNSTINLGLDYGFFDGRLRGSVEVYKRTSQDLLLSRSLPGVNGFTSILENIGEVVNKGLEISFTTINLDLNGFKWTSDFNISFLDNEVTKLLDGVDVLPGNLSVRVGFPLFTNVGTPYAGVNPANGRPMWYDINGSITYLPVNADQRPLGHQNLSTTFGGFTNTFNYKGIELVVFFQYDYGRTALNTMEFRLADLGGAQRNGLISYYNDRWTTPGQITSVPRPADTRTLNSGRVASYQTATRFYQDASYIRLKQLSLGYNLPNTWLNRLKIANVKLYFTAVNLVTWTNWTGYDPEFVDLGSSNQGVIPQARNYTFGIQIGL